MMFYSSLDSSFRFQAEWNRILKWFETQQVKDKNGVANISPSNLLAICEDVFIFVDKQLIELMVTAADKDDDGSISHEEYVRCMRQMSLFQTATR